MDHLPSHRRSLEFLAQKKEPLGYVLRLSVIRKVSRAYLDFGVTSTLVVAAVGFDEFPEPVV